MIEVFDIIFKVGTPLALLVLAAMSSRFVSRKEFEAVRAHTGELHTAVQLLIAQQKVSERVEKRMVSLEERIRAIEIVSGRHHNN